MNDVLAGLRVRFLDRCVGDLERLDDLAARGDLDVDEMRDLVHSLAGAAGTFGFPEISAAAGECDDAFAQDGAPDLAGVKRLAAAIRTALAKRAG
ncbi:MAG: Hpt domain-containing protein [Brevundimonas sp.]|uniref:Hpt domain-containing protein n=1 Tax=Brevundimonas sp. TaxID=1871086 RepID=UPI00391CFD71